MRIYIHSQLYWNTLIKIEMDAYSVYMSSMYTPIVELIAL